MRKVVYTAIIGSFDQLHAPAAIEEGIDYVDFADETSSVPVPWKLRPILRRERNSRMTARWHKFHPNPLLRDYDLSLYIDGNDLLAAPVSDLMEHMTSSVVNPKIASSPTKIGSEFRIQADTSNLLNRVWFIDSKFAIPLVEEMMRTSNPPH